MGWCGRSGHRRSPACELKMIRGLCLFRCIAFGIVLATWLWPGGVIAAAEPSAQPSDDGAAAVPAEPPPEPGRPRLLTPMPATPESRRELQALAAENGTDPTAVVGFYQLQYEHDSFSNGRRDNLVAATVSLAITPSWALRATLPYVWDQPNQPGTSNAKGVSDLTIRMGWRIYHSSYLALALGADALFPTASKDQLGLGKYDLGPGILVAVPAPRLRSMLSVQAQSFFTLVNNGDRPNTRWARMSTTFNTLWSERWWSLLELDLFHDWEQHDRTSGALQGEVGHRLGGHWRLFVRPGVGLWGKEFRGGYSWNLQAGVRWMIPGSIFSKALFEGFSGD
jgi:hypothetical protein